MAVEGGFTGGARRRASGKRRIAAAALILLAQCRGAAAADARDLTALPLEQLLTMEVYSASRFVQKASQAPSTVSVISAADIKAFGWRTLADVLRSVRGLYLSYDRNYSYLGARGFLRPGDYNSRFLLQIDGNRINDSVYDQAPAGAEFPLDLALIERIEYVPGPGSSIYGANAFFGVINVITKQAGELDGARATVSAGSYGAREGAASYGWHEQGNTLLLSASRYRSDGPDLYFPEFDSAGQQHGMARGLDYESGQRFLAKAGSGPFSLSLLHAERSKGIPTASFGMPFDVPGAYTVDTQTYLDLGYRQALAGDAELSGRLFWGNYRSVGDYLYEQSAAGPGVVRDGSGGRWWGFDLKTVSTPAAGHKLVAGAEFQSDYQLAQFSDDLASGASFLDDNRHSRRLGLYLQDEVSLRDDLLLNAGLRYDHHSRSGGMLNPRLALIWQAGPATTLKAMYGTAYREPNSYELYYAYPGPDGQMANPALRRERIRSKEVALVQQLAQNERLTVSVFHNVVSDLISQTTDVASGQPVYANAQPVSAYGVETEYERSWSNLATLRASYSWQKLKLDGGPANAPANLAKLNLAAPLWHSRWRAGLEAQYVGARDTLRGQAGGFWLANLNFSAARLARNVDLALGIYNLFDRRYADPAPPYHVQDTLAQDGRTLRLTMSYGF